MNRRSFFVLPIRSMPESTRKPNVIWFLVDQMRTQSLGIAGDPNAITPTLDRMAREGVWYREALSGFPLCSPARACFLTGRYDHGVPFIGQRMRQDLPTFVDPLKQAGYRTAWFGKWHLDGHDKARPAPRGDRHFVPRERRAGFDTWLGYEVLNQPQDCTIHGHDGDREVPFYRLPGHETGSLTDLLLDWLDGKEKEDDPFFACVSVQPPHEPHFAPREWQEKFRPADQQLRPNVPGLPRIRAQAREELAGYNASIAHIDANVERVLRRLRETGLDRDTYVVFFSDHGDCLGSHGFLRKQNPLEESIRIPFIVWGGYDHSHHGRKGTDGRDCRSLLNHVDVPVTTLGLCGLEAPDGMAGYDYSGSVTGRDNPLPEPETAYLQGIWPCVWGKAYTTPWRGIVTRDGWKYVCQPHGVMHCFNLNEDPYEEVDLAHHFDGHAARLRLQPLLRDWLDRLGDPFPLPDLPGWDWSPEPLAWQGATVHKTGSP